jgi:hypothetical protein
MGRPIGSSLCARKRSATGPIAQKGIEKRKTSNKKIAGDLFFDVLFNACLFMTGTPCIKCLSVGLRLLYRLEGEKSCPKWGIPWGIWWGKKGGGTQSCRQADRLNGAARY